MGSISSLSRAYSGLMSHQKALNVTAHNLANASTPGYVRQQAIYHDANYDTIGHNALTKFQLGLGTDVVGIRQIRDMFLDASYRQEISRKEFYAAIEKTISEIEDILGEVQGESFSATINDMWESLNELAKHPNSLEARGMFIQNAVLFVEKANLIGKQLEEYQLNINSHIEDRVGRINEIGHEIYRLNEIINIEEINGSQANDYRDQRNMLLDELAEIVDMSYRTDVFGNVLVNIENVPFVTMSTVSELGMIQSEEYSALQDPYWPHLSKEGPPKIIYKMINLNNPIGPNYDNNKGELKGLILSRGTRKADYTDLKEPTYSSAIKNSTVMRVQAQFDNLVHGIVTMVNDIISPNTATDPKELAPDAPVGLNNTKSVELFTRKHMPRYDENGHFNEEDPANEYSLYSVGNIEVNKEILLDYNKLALSANHEEPGDNTIVQKIIRKWQEEFSTLEPGATAKYKPTDYYRAFVADVGNYGETAKNHRKNQELMVIQTDNRRKSVSAVSQDEELSNLVKFQHSYNASARMVTVIDQMIGRIIDQMGSGR